MSRLSTILRDTEQTVTSGACLELKALSQVGEVSAGMWCSSSQCVSGKKTNDKVVACLHLHHAESGFNTDTTGFSQGE